MFVFSVSLYAVWNSDWLLALHKIQPLGCIYFPPKSFGKWISINSKLGYRYKPFFSFSFPWNVVQMLWRFQMYCTPCFCVFFVLVLLHPVAVARNMTLENKWTSTLKNGRLPTELAWTQGWPFLTVFPRVAHSTQSAACVFSFLWCAWVPATCVFCAVCSRAYPQVPPEHLIMSS